MITSIVLTVYAVFLIAGGYFGFKKGSPVSLWMGLASGAMIFLGLWLLTINPRGGWIFLSGLNGLLVLVFLMRLLKTHAFMPSGMLLAVSLAAVVYCIAHLVKG